MKLQLLITKYLSLLIKIFILVSFGVFVVYLFQTPIGAGDESLFINDLDFIKSNGWIAAIEKKIALTYLAIVYPISLIVPNYIALRLTNVLLFMGLRYYFYKNNLSNNKLFFYYLLFFSSRGWFLLGTNDVLFSVSLVIFFMKLTKF